MLLVYRALAEMIGTFTIIFVGGGSTVLSERYPHLFPAFFVPVIWGGVITLAIMAMGKVSGAHFNPAVTFSFAFAKGFPLAQVFLYWLGQLLGGLAAVGLLTMLQKT